MPRRTKIEEMFVKDQQYGVEHGATVAEVEKISWPIQKLDIHKPRDKGDEYVIVCARYKSTGAQNVKTIME